jgi:molybdopterin/thiamine biosynthesis adenylyltransferase
VYGLIGNVLNSSNIEFARNLGFISAKEQQQLHKSVVAIAGCGGDGGAIAEQMARLGVGEIRLADPDIFELENINRQVACNRDTIGVNKATAVSKHLHGINPDIKVLVFPQGVNTDTISAFMEGVDLLIDETEFTLPHLGVLLARQARRRNIPVLMALNVGFGASITTFHPHRKSFEAMLGLNKEMPLRHIAKQKISLSRWLPYVPSYLDEAALKKVVNVGKSAPSIAPGVSLAAGTAAIQALLILFSPISNHRPTPVYAPRFITVDMMTGRNKIVRYALLSHYVSLSYMLIRNKLRKVPLTSY